jgi:hypothetical protein
MKTQMFKKLTNWPPEPEVVRSIRTGDIHKSCIYDDLAFYIVCLPLSLQLFITDWFI